MLAGLDHVNTLPTVAWLDHSWLHRCLLVQLTAFRLPVSSYDEERRMKKALE